MDNKDYDHDRIVEQINKKFPSISIEELSEETITAMLNTPEYIEFGTKLSEALKKEICDTIELCLHNEINPTLIAGFCKIFKNYNLNFTEEFHKLVLCLLNVNSFGKKLSKSEKSRIGT